MEKNAERRASIGISSSVLGGCPRQHILGQRNDYYEDPEDYYARWMGSFGHYAIEMDGPYPGVVQEVRFYREIDTEHGPIEISGQPDWIDTRLGMIADTKMTGYKPRQPRDEHVQQLNVYRWIVEGGYVWHDHQKLGPGERIDYQPGFFANPIPRGFRVSELELRYYHPGKNGRHTEFDVPIWTDEAIEGYIRRNLKPYADYEATGNLAGIGLTGSHHAWRANYCPFRHRCNPGICCQAQNTALLSGEMIEEPEYPELT